MGFLAARIHLEYIWGWLDELFISKIQYGHQNAEKYAYFAIFHLRWDIVVE